MVRSIQSLSILFFIHMLLLLFYFIFFISFLSNNRFHFFKKSTTTSGRSNFLQTQLTFNSQIDFQRTQRVRIFFIHTFSYSKSISNQVSLLISTSFFLFFCFSLNCSFFLQHFCFECLRSQLNFYLHCKHKPNQSRLLSFFCICSLN